MGRALVVARRSRESMAPGVRAAASDEAGRLR